MITIFIAEDHSLVREGIKKLLSFDQEIKIIGEADNGNDAIQEIRHLKPDIALLDITMPGASGFDVLVSLDNMQSGTRFIMLSMYSGEQHELRMLQAGAFGFVSKNNTKEDLIQAIRKVHSGEKIISSSLATRLATSIGKDPALSPHEKLTDREYQILVKLALGETVTHIANELHLSVKTISGHRSHILEKMNMKTNAELTRYALDFSLI